MSVLPFHCHAVARLRGFAVCLCGVSRDKESAGSRRFLNDFRWWPQRDSNPCFSLERAVSWASRRWGQLNAWPEPTTNLLAGGGGFEPPLRGPEPRVLPLDDPPPNAPTLPHPDSAPRLGRATEPSVSGS